MKKIALYTSILTVLLLSLSGCTSYYYSILDSTDRNHLISRNNTGEFIQENDSVRISYNFYGEDAPIHITIYNKLEEPVYIDWTRSAIIIDEVATSYYEGIAPIQGDTYIYNNPATSSSQGSFSGGIAFPHGINVIPPQARIENTPLTLSNLPFKQIPKKEFTKTSFPVEDSKQLTIYLKEYTEADSPPLLPELPDSLHRKRRRIIEQTDGLRKKLLRKQTHQSRPHFSLLLPGQQGDSGRPLLRKRSQRTESRYRRCHRCRSGCLYRYRVLR